MSTSVNHEVQGRVPAERPFTPYFDRHFFFVTCSKAQEGGQAWPLTRVFC